MVLVSTIRLAASAAGKAVKSGVGKAAASTNPKQQLPVGLRKPVPVSPALKKFLGSGEISRTETIKKLWAYIKDHNLQDPAARREIASLDFQIEVLSDVQGKTKSYGSFANPFDSALGLKEMKAAVAKFKGPPRVHGFVVPRLWDIMNIRSGDRWNWGV
ncbi:hypothetical protein R1flu_028752 [Riccia fluitans]|uniref:DM2 domain-containing protein n=1 Tax=Riccia fluitans TaxID=41844 RepID=A0ABD1XMK8_9MARC